MKNAQVAHVFEELADLLEIQGANPFRVRAYRNAARTIESLSHPLAEVAKEEGGLKHLPGIGSDLAQKINAVLETNTLPLLEELREQIPAGVLEMLKIPGLGPKRAKALSDALKIDSLNDLRAAAEAGAIAKLKGFGKGTEKQILEGLDRLGDALSRALLADAKEAADVIVADLGQLTSTREAIVAGSCRRLKETCGDLDVLATSDNPDEAMDLLAGHPLVESVLSRGETKQRVRLINGLELDLRVVEPEAYGSALVYFTGSKEHNIVLRRRAQKRNLKINEYGVFRGDERIAGKTEEDVYAAVDLPWIPPELREDRHEFEWAEAGILPDLVELKDIRGDLHMHTTATDGKATIEEMALAAKERGRKYIAITDHSKRVMMAGGLDAVRLRAHWKAIEKARKKVSGIEILCGIECDILEDATLDLSDDVLAEADWVIAVLHYGLRQPPAQIMKRLRTAVESPHVDVIGHPSGRMVGRRPGADIAWSDFLKSAADTGTLLELNANPHRLDIDDIQGAAAKELGIPIVISTDAHSPEGLDKMQYGIYQARRAGLSAADVANTRTFKQFMKLLK